MFFIFFCLLRGLYILDKLKASAARCILLEIYPSRGELLLASTIFSGSKGSLLFYQVCVGLKVPEILEKCGRRVTYL